MDTIPSDPQTNALIRKYGKGALDVGGALAHGLGSQILSGYAGLTALPHGMDAAADAVHQEQEKWGVHDLSPEGVDTIKAVAPAYRAVAQGPVGQTIKAVGDTYNDSVNQYADLASKYIGTPAGAQVAAAGAALPQAFVPGGAEAKGAEYALEQMPSELTRGAIPHTVSMESAGEDFQPTARAIVARHPETGAELGRMTVQPRGGVMTGVRSDVAPEAQGQGIGTKLLQRGIDHAYENGMDFASDTSVTPAQMQTYMKMREKGYPVDVNPAAEEWDSPDGPALRSTNGSPVVSVRRPTAAPDAMPEDNPPAMVVPHRNGFGAMMNGQILSTHGDQEGAQAAVGALNADHKYGSVAQQMTDNGGITYHPGTGEQPTGGYAVSLHKGREKVLPNQPTPQDIHDFISANQDAFTADPGAHFGEWHNKENGQHYLDVTHVDPDFDSAMQKAKANNQEAIFNLSNFETVPNPDFAAAPADAGVPHMADGGEVGTVLGGLGDLIKQFAPEAETIANHVGEHGGITYNPTTGDVHGAGYVIPSSKTASALDAAPSPEDVHDFLMANQHEFDEPNTVLHVHSDDAGNHFMHVAKYSPDFGHAADIAGQGKLPGFADIGTGEIHTAAPDSTAPPATPPESADSASVAQYLSGAPRTPTPWTHGEQTVANPKRNAFPGIYNDPRQVVADASAKVGPEDPLMQQLFGVSRGDLSDLSLSRQGNELGVLPGTKANPRGAASAQDVMTPRNEQRLVDVLSEARNSPELYKGMTGWYTMDPLYQRFKEIFGEDEAPAKYMQFNTLSGMASPGSSVDQEIARGTSANWLQTEGRFQDFIKHGGGVDAGPSGDRPADMADLPGHVYHRTAQAVPMDQYLRTGQMQMKSPKVPMYIQASGVPETGFQTDMPVGDAHWARGVGLADTRGTRTSKGQEIVPGSSVSTPEMDTLGPWWRNRVAGQAGLDSVPAQALAWGAFSPYTGVKSAIGAPKLEILSTQIGKLATRLGISPESARDLVISGKAGAFAEGGPVELDGGS